MVTLHPLLKQKSSSLLDSYSVLPLMIDCKTTMKKNYEKQTEKW